MATFYSLLGFMAVSGFEYSDPGSFDLISHMPMEIAIVILRYVFIVYFNTIFYVYYYCLLTN